MIVASARGHLGILEVVFPPGLAPRAPERFRAQRSGGLGANPGSLRQDTPTVQLDSLSDVVMPFGRVCKPQMTSGLKKILV
jgi:hypothetical protein